MKPGVIILVKKVERKKKTEVGTIFVRHVFYDSCNG